MGEQGASVRKEQSVSGLQATHSGCVDSMDDVTELNKDDVIAKLKDDGDFDRLRLQIIRKLKDNEELRNKIISTVKQSSALNRQGAESLKPRQLSDAIYEEVGSKVLSQISDSLWEIIRSADGMESEIADTVQSVCTKLLNPFREQASIQKVDSSGETSAVSNRSLKDLPGFSLPNNNLNGGEQHQEKVPLSVSHEKGSCDGPESERHYKHDLTPDDVDLGIPPGFSSLVETKKLWDGTDDDPDLPPGFS